MEITREKRGYKIAFIVVLIIVLLSSCIFTGSLVAWLTDEDISGSGDTLHLGSVEFEIYNGNTNITATKKNAEGITSTEAITYEITGNETIRNLDLNIRNTGTVAAIMRVTIVISYDDGGIRKPCLLRQKADQWTFNNEIEVSNSSWVNDFKGGVATGYSYYNSQIQPYTIKSIGEDGNVKSEAVTAHAVPVINSILVPDDMANTTYYIDITVEGVAHSGNIYQKKTEGEGAQIPVEAYPFGRLSEDFLNNKWTAWQVN